jgi:superfamily II helicase
MEMSDAYREVRSRMKKPMNRCFWCKYSFENGDMMALAHALKGGNKILCQSCAKELLESGDK